MKRYAAIIGVLVLLGLGGLWAVSPRTIETPGGGEKACTMEAKLCPDGSAVGRVGPNCEFAPCPPSETATSTPSDSIGGNSILPYNSGVRGTVSLGPTCPVERMPPDPVCADKPYATAVTVYRSGSKQPFIIGNSDANGTFQFSLPPGSYTLTAGSGTMLPRCSSIPLTIAPDAYTTTNISCDTGIR